MMSYDAEKLPNLHAGILIYRSMEDTVRTSYAQNIAPDIKLEAPLESYYGKLFTVSLHIQSFVHCCGKCHFGIQ